MYIKVFSSFFEGKRKNFNFYLIDALQYLNEMFMSSDATKRVAYAACHGLIKSVIYFALDIERIAGMVCLEKLCCVREIRDQVFSDTNLMTYMRGLLAECAIDERDQIRRRLHNSLKRFYNLFDS